MALSGKMPAVLAAALLGGGLAWSVWSTTHPPGPARSARRARSPHTLRTEAVANSSAAPATTTASDTSTPEESLAAALKITNRKLRLAEMSRLLQRWALRDPSAAFEWAISQTGTWRHTAVVAVLTSAAATPAAEHRLGAMLKAEDPEEADGFGLEAIRALTNERRYEAALQFTGGVDPDAGVDRFLPIFRAWGTSDPANALQALQTLDPAWREAVFQSLVNGWATSQPGAVGNYVLALPEGTARSAALSALGERWALQDPAAMADWLAGVPSSPVLDPLIAAMLTHSDGVNRPPSIAAAWADNISDPELRFNTMEHVVREWGQTDAADARAYVQLAPGLTASQRSELAQIIDPAPADNNAD